MPGGTRGRRRGARRRLRRRRREGARPRPRRSACRPTPTRRRCSTSERLDLVDIVTRQDTHRALVRAGDCARRRHHRAEALRPDLGGLRRHRRGRAKRPACGSRCTRISASRRRCGACGESIDSGAIGDAELGAHQLPHRLRRLSRRSPISDDEERLAIADVGIHVLDLARFFLGEVDAHLLRDAAPQSDACAARTPRPCCSATRAARSASSSAPTRRGAARPVPRDAGRDRGRRAVPSSSIRVAACAVTTDGETERDRHRRAAAVMDQPSLACQPGGRARRLPAFPRLPAARRCRRNVGRGQSQDLRAGRCGLPRGRRRRGSRPDEVGSGGTNIPSKSRRAR